MDRQIIRDIVLFELDGGSVLSAFVATMVRGWGTTSGRGALRTRWILTEADVRSNPPELLSVAPADGARLEAEALAVRGEGASRGVQIVE